MFDFFAEFLKDNYGIEHIELSTNFKKDLGLDSFDFVNIICAIEEKYGVELEEDRYRRLNTIGELIEYLNVLVQQERNHENIRSKYKTNAKRIFENLTVNTKNISALLEKLKSLSADSVNTSKNTEKQVNQSITFSQKEHEAISSNADKMLVLRQKIQMIAELILELSEH